MNWVPYFLALIQVVLLVTLGVYLIRKRNSSFIGWLVNLNLLFFLALLLETIVLTNSVLIGTIVGVLIVILAIIIFVGLSLSFIFLFANAIVVWRREGHSLASSLTLITGVGVILVDVLFFFDPIKAPEPIKVFINVLLSTIIFYILLTVWNTLTSMFIYRWYFPKKNKDYIIVLGAGLVDGYKVGRLLGNRINTAISFYSQQIFETQKHPKLIFSGGQGGDEKLPEAEAMQKYAIQHGASAQDTLIENKSVNTFQNMKFSKQLIKSDGGNDQSKVVFVTNNFHTMRAGILADRVGLKAYGIGVPTPFYYLPNAVIREYLALFVMHKRFHIIMFILIFLIAVLNGVITWIN